MLRGQQTLIDRIDMSLWNGSRQKILPERSPQVIFPVLQRLGIVMVVSEGRVNVPEIYLHSFQVNRKNGLRRLRK